MKINIFGKLDIKLNNDTLIFSFESDFYSIPHILPEVLKLKMGTG